MYAQSMIAYGAPLAARTMPTPAPKGREALVEVRHCGLCHSDLHLHEGAIDLGDGKSLDIRSGRVLPFTLGHEICGTVAAVGEGVTERFGGGLYAVYPWAGCGACDRCARGDEHLCDDSRHIGVNRDGGFASHVLVADARHLIDVDGVAPELAGSLMCSGITAYGAINRATPFLEGRPLMVIGLGGVGLMAVRIACAMTDGPVLAADIDPRKREAALAAGAAGAFDPRAEGVRKAVMALKGPCGAAVDFVGSGDTVAFAAGVTGKAAAIVVAGLMGGRMTMPVPMFPLRALSIIGTFVASLEEARDLVALVKAGRVIPQPAELVPLAEANAAMERLRRGDVVGRLVLTP
jgi:D-arabinose 1-dehydrogenase-like Zn-dependent alcohol dehydrogenase